MDEAEIFFWVNGNSIIKGGTASRPELFIITDISIKQW
jgi:hypothetical protein